MSGTGKRKKQTAKRMLIKGFLQSFFIVAILLGAAAVGYQATIKLWSVEEKQEPVVTEVTPTPEPITTPRVDEISKNLIFCYNKDDNRISRILLEVFNCQKKELAYITIPIDTKLTMSDALYRRLIVVKPEIPQIIKFSSVTKYLEDKTLFEYGVLMAEELLGTDISYYTVIPEELFTDIFEEQLVPPNTSAVDLLPAGMDDEITVTGAADEKEAVVAGTAETEETSAQEKDKPEHTQVFTEKYLKKIGKLDSEAKIEAYLKKLYPKLNSNLPLADKLSYAKSYAGTPMNRVIFLRLAGEERNSGFEPDPIRLAVQLQELTAGPADSE